VLRATAYLCSQCSFALFQSFQSSFGPRDQLLDLRPHLVLQRPLCAKHFRLSNEVEHLRREEVSTEKQRSWLMGRKEGRKGMGVEEKDSMRTLRLCTTFANLGKSLVP
jgi:hypothetical protein